jgi:hypothetical protein
MVIENFAVEYDDHVAIRTDQRLVTAFQVNNAQARGAQRDEFRLKPALVVRPAMRERRKRRVHHAARQTSTDVRVPEYATHSGVAFFGQKKVRIYPLRRTHFCDLFDCAGTAPSIPIISNHTHAVFFPTWLELRLRRLYAFAKHCQEKNKEM